MANPKLNNWRRTSLTANLTEDDIKRRDSKYLEWLAHNRGWLTYERDCSSCKGTGKTQSHEWRRRRSHYVTRDCSVCDGSGKVPTDKPLPDIAKARAYVREQEHQLEERAQFAVASLKHRLFWHGFRPVVTGSNMPANSETAYQCREDLRDHINAQLSAAWEAASELRQAWNDAAAQPGFDWNADSDAHAAAVQTAEQKAEELRCAVWRIGQQHLDCWAMPGNAAAIYIGTRAQRRGYGHVDCAHSIVIKAGRAPSEQELDQLAAEAIAAVSGNAGDTLPIAA